jgi:hypothetical protein
LFLAHSHSLDPGSFVSFSLRFSAHDSTAPVLPDFLSSFIVVSPDGLDDLTQVLLVLVVDFGKANGGALFSSDELSESGFAFDNAVWDVHLSAQSWEVDDDFDWVDVVGDEHELGLLSLDEVDDFVDAGGEHVSSGFWGVWLTVGSGLCSGDEAGFLFVFGLWSVLSSQFKHLSGVLFVQALIELVDSWGNLQS